MIKLASTSGLKQYSWSLKAGEYRVGRSEKCHLFIQDGTISRHHAVIEVKPEDEQLYLTDLGSLNGTYLNGERVIGTAVAKIGDILAFGAVELKILGPDETETPPCPASTLAEVSDANLLKSVVIPINEALRPRAPELSGMRAMLPAIFEMAKMLVLSEPREMMLDRSLRLIAKVIPAERIAVLLKDESDLGISCAASFSPGDTEPGAFSLSRTIIGDILANKNSMLISDIKEIPHFAEQQSVIISGIKTAMAVPLFDEGDVLGILYADSRNPAHKYNDEYLKHMAIFGNLIASRILNYSLLTERQNRRLLQAELDRASSIQADLLPKSLPQFPGYQIGAYQKQSLQVGGDMYDAALLQDGRLVFLVGDVSGHGMGAALLMSDIIGAFRVLNHDPYFELARAVEIVSKELYKHSDPENFATLFIGALDPSSHVIEYVSAGHNPPILVRHTGEVVRLQPTGIIVGVIDDAFWEKKTITMDDGDLVFLFSDGLSEARHEDDFYGEERIVDVLREHHDLSADKILRAVIDDVDVFRKNTAIPDDITILMLKRSNKD